MTELGKYIQLLYDRNLSLPEDTAFSAQDATIITAGEAEWRPFTEAALASLGTRCMILARPPHPLQQMLRFLSDHYEESGVIHPRDSETRTFLHNIPVVDEKDVVDALKEKKTALTKDGRIAATGAMTVEQGFVNYSSALFSLFVLFFVESCELAKEKLLPENRKLLAVELIHWYREGLTKFSTPRFISAPFNSEKKLLDAIHQAGKATVDAGLVDSFFGNISMLHNDILYISQTGSTLDKLEGHIDRCPMDDSRTSALTSSSEFSAHRAVYENNPDLQGILHGHPRFAVILSMLCEDRATCKNARDCNILCSRDRMIFDIPVVPGEVGTGPTGIATTLPPAFRGRGVMVYGHGLFAAAWKDFNEAFETMMDLELLSLKECEGILVN